MSIIKFTEGDKLAAVTAEAGWYIMSLTKLEARKSKNSESMNYFATFAILDEGRYQNKEIDQCYNTSTKNASVLGGWVGFPDTDILKIAAATKGVDLKDVDLNLDTDELLNVPFKGKVDVFIGDSGPLNRVIDYKHVNYQVSEKPF